MKRICQVVDLKDDPALIKEYEEYHQRVWPEVLESLRAAGILRMEIYRWQTRLFMVAETTDDFTLERKKQMDDANPKVQEWEELMWNYQEALPTAKPGEKWQPMHKVFEL